ncbi:MULTISPECIES: hypothetical protein [unclassified Lentimicrobium]|uniref:hypothetical protein n=1 Tax=unclassified Lentimicrobium TaxID=2677434 RepID=UPI001557FA7D|nr:MULTISPECIES: hypothetical protein [unclassified Lentimicrobium]NPD48356.1 hypothetical protein [Lentimicrobium sp. S6]NPD86634.1 hypothetical protein [Lentimicrobium sp. L6]
MKNIKKISITAAFIIFTAFAFAQTPPPPNNGQGTPSGGNTPVGGGAPVGSGIVILLFTAGAYGYAKWKNQVPDNKIEE